jgi:hypothetical protein
MHYIPRIIEKPMKYALQRGKEVRQHYEKSQLLSFTVPQIAS